LISRKAEPTAPAEIRAETSSEVFAAAKDMPQLAAVLDRRLVVRLASTDQDAAAIHAFLCDVAAASGALRCRVNPEKSMREVWRVVRAFDLAEPEETPYGFALVAERAGEVVGTLGVICPDWWYGDGKFFTDRWFFTRPVDRSEAGPALRAEAEALAAEAGLPFVLNLKQRRAGNVIYTRFG
jgi:hypothetical protein